MAFSASTGALSHAHYPVKSERRSYVAPSITPLTALPFVTRHPRRKHVDRMWHVPPLDDYGQACSLGHTYATHLLQYMKDNPAQVGSNVLGRIAGHMDFSDKSEAKGVIVGFFSHLERFLYAAVQYKDVFDALDAHNQSMRELVDYIDRNDRERGRA